MNTERSENALRPYKGQDVTISKGFKLIRGVVSEVKPDGRFLHEDDHGRCRDCHNGQIIVAGR